MFSILPALVAKLQHWQARRQALNALYAMDDRALADIGLSRGDIGAAVKDGAAFRPPAPYRGLPAAANTITARAA